jgi:hypothetical protein
MPDMTKLLKELEDEDQRRMPTPPLGESVTWYENGDKHAPRAAIVTAIEGPGKVALTVFKLRSHPSYVQGVFHVSHPIHNEKGNPTTQRCGYFTYPGETEDKGKKAPGFHYDFHQRDIARRRQDALSKHEAPQALAAS